MRVTVGALRSVLVEALKDELTAVEPGDLVDVALDYAYGPYRRIRVLKLVSNVSDASGVTDVSDPLWYGPGFLGVNEDPENDDMEPGEKGWFTMDDIIPDSKLKYYMIETIHKCGSKWCLYSKSTGKKLGTHDTKEDALDQERAIKA